MVRYNYLNIPVQMYTSLAEWPDIMTGEAHYHSHFISEHPSYIK